VAVSVVGVASTKHYIERIGEEQRVGADRIEWERAAGICVTIGDNRVAEEEECVGGGDRMIASLFPQRVRRRMQGVREENGARW